MLKLIKYELRKQALSKIIIVLLITAFELLFLFGIMLNNETVYMFSNALLWITIVIAILYLLFEPGATYENDLGKKQGYLLFMTPNSNFKIIGAKVLSGALQIIVSFTLFIMMTIFNQKVFSWKYGYISGNQLDETFNAFGDVGFSFQEFVVTIVFITLLWVGFITLSFLATSLGYSVVTKGKLSGFVSALIFVVLLLIEIFVLGSILIIFVGNDDITQTAFNVISLLIVGIPAIINYIGASVVLEKKVSL